MPVVVDYMDSMTISLGTTAVYMFSLLSRA